MKYNTTSDYHWPDLELENTNALVENGNVISPNNGDGPFGFQYSLEISSGQVSTNSVSLFDEDFPTGCVSSPPTMMRDHATKEQTN